MRNWTKFALLYSILFTVEVKCDIQCNVTGGEYIRDPGDGLVVIPGSKVIISCCGDVSVNGVRMVQGTCTGQHRSDYEQITAKEVGPLLSNHRPDPVDSLETNQLQGEALTLHERTATTDDEADSDWPQMDNWSQWTLNDKPVENISKMDGNLILPHFGFTESGNYSCYRAGRQMSTVIINLSNSTEKPILTCRRKNPYRKIQCDWKASRPISPAPKCHLILKTRCSSEQKRMLCCRYSARRSRCRCLIEPQGPEETQCTDSSWYLAVLYVRSTLGSRTSETIRFTPAMKPDPPSGVNVTSLEGTERTLQVSWSYPMSWKKKEFYHLKFELRYHPKHGKIYQTRSVEKPPHSFLITDALPDVQYIVQIRAREEHDEGNWSDWSPPVYAHTWTAPVLTQAPNTTDIIEDPWNLMVKPDPSTKPELVGRPGVVDSLMWVHMVSVTGCCVVLIMFILVFVQVIRSFRHRTHFKSKEEKLRFPLPCQPNVCPPSSSPTQKQPRDLL